VPFTSVHAGEYGTEDKLKTGDITKTKNNQPSLAQGALAVLIWQQWASKGQITADKQVWFRLARTFELCYGGSLCAKLHKM